MILNFFQGGDGSEFFAKFIPENETIALLSQESNDLVHIKPATSNILNLGVKSQSKLRNCDPDTKRMTPCVMKKYDDMFGTHFNKIFKKNLHLIDSVTPGVASAANVTGKDYFLSC